MDDQNKNLILATALSFLVILVWFWLFPPETPDQTAVTAPATTQTTTGQTPTDGVATTPSADATILAPSVDGTPADTRAAALGKTTRVPVKTPRVEGSISLVGGRIDDLRLLDYNVKLNDPSVKETLLSPAGGPKAYYALYGWAPADGLEFTDVPGANTPWQVAQGTSLTPSSPVTLTWDNGKGLIFNRKISIDDNYLFSITQSVQNNTGAAVKMQPYGIIARQGEPDTIGFYILHEGVVRASDGIIEEIKFKDMPDAEFVPAEGGNVLKTKVEENGWIGFTDNKYWQTILVADPGQAFSSVAKYTASNDVYQTDMRLPTMTVAPGAVAQAKTSLFAGAKEWETIRNYEAGRKIEGLWPSFSYQMGFAPQTGINDFVDSIDWGWFFFLTKPIFLILHWLHSQIGNMGWSIIGLTFFIKALLFPLAYKSYVSMARMKQLQPEMEKLKEKHGDDRQAMQQGMMKLYKEKKVNPAAGCLPILLQIPIFFSLYKVIFVTIELRHAPFIGWVHDLSAPDPTSILNLFGLLPFDAPDQTSFLAIFSIGVLPILMGITMWLQQKLNPAPTDKTQAQIFAWMPWVFMFMLGRFASGLVVYWVANNTLTFIQQYTIMRSQGVKPDIFGNIKSSLPKKKAKTK